MDDLLGGVFGKTLTECGITVHRDVFVDVFGVDDAAVTKRDAHLLLIEAGLVQRHVDAFFDDFAAADIVIHEALDETTFEQVLGHDFFDVIGFDAAVKRAFRIDDNNGAERAQTEATGLHDFHFIGETVRLKVLREQLLELRTTRRGTTGTAADQYL